MDTKTNLWNERRKEKSEENVIPGAASSIGVGVFPKPSFPTQTLEIHTSKHFTHGG